MNGKIEQQKDQLNNGLSRKDFLRLCWLSLPAFFLAACEMPPPTKAIPPPSTPLEVPLPPVEVKGPMPGTYSQIIKENRLQPTVFTEQDMPNTRIKMAIDYLKRYRDALLTHPDHRGQPLTTYHINTLDNYPISIPNNINSQDYSKDNWTIYDVVNTLLTEINNGKTILVYDPALPEFAGTINFFELQDGKWVRKTTVKFGADFMKITNFYESPTSFYNRLTDVEGAITLLHLYSHGLQDEMILTYLNNDLSALSQVGTDPNLVSDWVKKQGQNKSESLRSMTVTSGSLSAEEAQSIKFNEAQANAVAYSLLLSLNGLNGSTRFPGTRRIDPLEDQVRVELTQIPGLHYVNLYKIFLEQVVQQQNALSSLWLIEGGR